MRWCRLSHASYLLPRRWWWLKRVLLIVAGPVPLAGCGLRLAVGRVRFCVLVIALPSLYSLSEWRFCFVAGGGLTDCNGNPPGPGDNATVAQGDIIQWDAGLGPVPSWFQFTASVTVQLLGQAVFGSQYADSRLTVADGTTLTVEANAFAATVVFKSVDTTGTLRFGGTEGMADFRQAVRTRTSPCTLPRGEAMRSEVLFVVLLF